MEAVILGYGVFFLTLGGVYALLALGLNVQWGYVGMLNVGIAAFFAVGAYASAILTGPADPAHLGGFGLPVWLGMSGAAFFAALLGLAIGLVTLRLRSDYLAIASIGIAEIVRLVLKNEDWLTNGVRGIAGIPRPFEALWPGNGGLAMLLVVWGLVFLAFLLNHRAHRSPWGRVLRGIRDNEPAARAMGKNSLAFRLQAFVLGCAVMGLAGSAYAHFVGFISPEAFDPVFATFLVWVMLIAGGSGNNTGAILGALLIWGVWSGTEILTGYLPAEVQTQAGALRVLAIGVLLQAILILRPEGLLPERPPRPVWRKETSR
ncbi:MAG: branched-chain amino acid ABC transporter permease [Geminicoccaceae bacterium]|nr:branched-chain amino acid ABC transporter permease [Geminicoccaceae bacterium]